MIDIQFIREHPEEVAEKSKQKGYEVDVAALLASDSRRRELLTKVEELRAERNQLNESFKGRAPEASELDAGKKIKDQLSSLEDELKTAESDFISRLKTVPNMPAADVPIGASEAENVVAKEVGDKPQLDFQPKSHWQIAEARGLIDKERAAKVSGSRFAYIKGDLVLLQMAIMQFVYQTLTSEESIKKIIQQFGLENTSAKPFIPVLPPAMIKTEVYDAMDRLEPRDDRYAVGEDEDNLWLQGSAEHTLGPMYMDEILPAGDLPLRYLGFLTSFRREAGTYGKDTEGIIRMHQFDKMEMESFSSAEQGLSEHLLMVAIQEYLVQQLKLPYRVLQKCTADIGKPNVRGIDIEVWMPGQNMYKETHTADFMTDYQSRRLRTRSQKPNSPPEFIHTNDATAFAMGRTLVAIIENYQNQDGSITVPEVLRTFMGGKDKI
jgi:seryl-tRNA synthetase